MNPSGSANIGSTVYALIASGQKVKLGDPSTVAYVANNPNARYVQAYLGAFPTEAGTPKNLPPINNWDLTLLKRFNITERFRFELSGQAYNLFNHPQYIAGSLNDVGRVTTFNSSTQALVTVTNPAFAQPDQVFLSNARSMQIVAKFIF